MRLILASAGIAFLATSGSAMAADCTKGLLWPYVRNPGDCLTDTEIQAGKTGVYTGPSTGQVDVSAIKPPPQAMSNAVQCSRSLFWPFVGDDCQAAPTSTVTQVSPAANNSVAVAPSVPAPTAVKPQAAATPAAPPAVQSAQPQAALPPAAATIRVAQANTAECQKGVFWPFIRDAGDCLTASEKASGKTPDAPIAASTSGPIGPVQTCSRSWLWPIVSDTCVTQNVAAQTAPVMPAVAGASPPPPAGCTKGTFWPFIRETGDCLTASEKASGKSPDAPIAASAPVATAPAVTPPTPVMPAVAVASPPPPAGCTKGTFWPFIRETGDCLTASEKASGKTPDAPIAASAPVATAPAVAPPAPAMPAVAVASPPPPAGCTKGTFWPFIREAGDCPTAAEVASGQSAPAPAAAHAPAPIPAAPAQASGPAASDSGACHKGLFWPFVRENGDCPTGADKAAQH